MLFIKGIIIGIAKVIPGFSGAIVMIGFNLYDRAVDSVCHFFSDIKSNFIFLFNLGLGIVVGIIGFSNVINYLITNYYLYTFSFFIGLIMSGFPLIWKSSSKNISLVIISFSIIFGLGFFVVSNNYVISNSYVDGLVFFLAGIVEAFGMVVPGISSTSLLMLMGVYNYYINIVSNIYNIYFVISNLFYIVSMGVGVIVGFMLFIYLINYLFRYYRSDSFSVIFGICFSSILLLVIRVIPLINNLYVLFISILFVTIGYVLGIKI